VLTDGATSRPAIGRKEAALLALAAVALALGVALVQGEDVNAFGNMGYLHVVEARQVLAGRGFGRFYAERAEYEPDLFLRPTYTLFVAPVVALLRDWTAIRAVVAAMQGLLLAVTALCAAGCVARACAPRAARLCAWLVVLHPVLVSQASTLVDTALFTASMVGAYAAISAAPADAPRPRWFVAGLVLGVAVLTRSTAVAVVPAACLVVARKIPRLRGRLAVAGLVALGATSALAPWFARNYADTGRVLLSTVDGVNLWMGNNADTSRFLDDDRSLDELPGRDRYDASGMMPVATALERYDASRRAAIDFIRERPADAAVLAARKAADLWAVRPTPRSTRSASHDVKSLVLAAWTLPLFAFGAFGALVALRSGGALRAFAVDVLVICVVFTIPHALAWGGTRLRAPIDPFVVALASIGVVAATDKLRRRRPAS